MTRRAWVLFAAMSALWGLPYLLIKVAVAELDPAVLVLLRLALAASVLLPMAAAKNALRPAMRRWRRLVLVGAVGIAAPFVLIAYGELHISSSLAALLIAADPLFVVVVALPFDPAERVSGLRLIGLVLGLVGVGALYGLDVGGDALALLGGALVLLAALCYAIAALLVKAVADVPRLGSVTITLTVAAVLMAPFGLTRLPTTWPGPSVVASIVALGVACTALAYLIYYALIAEAGATRASLITYVNPAVAVLLGVLVLSEPLTFGMVLGFALIVIGCALATGIRPKPDDSAPDRKIPTTGAELVEGSTS